MKKTKELNLDVLLLSILTVLCFLAFKDVITNIIYVLFAGLLALFFFPLKLYKNKEKLAIISFTYFLIIIGLSVPLLFIENSWVETTFKVLAMLNTGFIGYYFYKGNRNLLIRHAVFLLFTPVIFT